jgi:hypothetical protein
MQHPCHGSISPPEPHQIAVFASCGDRAASLAGKAMAATAILAAPLPDPGARA